MTIWKLSIYGYPKHSAGNFISTPTYGKVREEYFDSEEKALSRKDELQRLIVELGTEVNVYVNMVMVA